MDDSQFSELTYNQLIEIKAQLEIELSERQSEYEDAELKREQAMFDDSIDYDRFLGYAYVQDNTSAFLKGCYEELEAVKRQINKLKNHKED